MSKAGLGLGFGDLLESSVQEGPCSCFGHSNRLSAPPFPSPCSYCVPFWLLERELMFLRKYKQMALYGHQAGWVTLPQFSL